jgi:hypothetical protein
VVNYVHAHDMCKSLFSCSFFTELNIFLVLMWPVLQTVLKFENCNNWHKEKSLMKL